MQTTSNHQCNRHSYLAPMKVCGQKHPVVLTLGLIDIAPPLLAVGIAPPLLAAIRKRH